jgi:hypothetical protein
LGGYWGCIGEWESFWYNHYKIADWVIYGELLVVVEVEKKSTVVDVVKMVLMFV